MATVNFCPECGKKLFNNVKFCPGCGYKINNITGQNVRQGQTGNNNKRDKVLAQKVNRNKKNIYFTLGTVVIVISIIFYMNAKPSKEESVINEQPTVTEMVSYPSVRYDHSYSVALSKDGKIILPLDIIKEKKFMKFDYIGKNTTVPLLAYFTESGKIVTAISMCEPCNSTSFHIKGSDLICNSCGTTWDLNNLEAKSGSCGKYPPDPIQSKVVGNEVQIDEYLVDNWTRRN